MLNPFAAWASWNRVAMDMARLSYRWGEMAVGAGQVIGARSDLIHSAMMAPHSADYAELSRMVPEKMSAGAVAWTGIMRQTMDWQMDAFTPLALSRRSHAIGKAALDPFHRRVKANVRRLRR